MDLDFRLNIRSRKRKPKSRERGNKGLSDILKNRLSEAVNRFYQEYQQARRTGQEIKLVKVGALVTMLSRQPDIHIVDAHNGANLTEIGIFPEDKLTPEIYKTCRLRPCFHCDSFLKSLLNIE